MAEKLVSPGVFIEENDRTFRQAGVSQISGAFVGPTEKGPAFEPVTVESAQEYIEIFGQSGSYTDFAVLNYLRDAGSATVVRVLGGGPSAVDEGVAGYVSDIYEIRESNASDLGSGDSITNAEQDVLALLAPTGNAPDDLDQDISLTGAGTFDEFDLEVNGNTYRVSLNPSKSNYIKDVFGTSPEGPREVYVLANFFELHEEIRDGFTGTLNVELNVRAETLDFDNQGFSNASTPWIVSQDLLEEQPMMEDKVQLFRFHTLSDGNDANRDVKVAVQNVRTPDEVTGSDYGLFDVVVRDFGDTDLNQDVLETYTDVNLDPESPRFIARVIGNRNVIFEADGGTRITGDYQNNSEYVRVEVNPDVIRANEAGKNDQANLIPWGFESYLFPYQLDEPSALPHGVKTRENQSRVDADYDAKDTADWTQVGQPGDRTSNQIHYGFDFTYDSNLIYLNPVQNDLDVEDVDTVSTDFNFSDSVGYNASTDERSFERLEQSERKFILGFQGGFDGKDISVTPAKGEDITASNTQGFDCSTFDAPGSLSYFDALNILSNKERYNINLLVTPGIVQSLHSSVVEAGVDLVEERRDVFYVLDAAGVDANVQQVTQAVGSLDTSYAGTYYPWVRARDNSTNQILELPPSVLIPRVYAFNDQIADPWFAPAGLQRGGIPEARETVRRLTKDDRDTLYQARVNPIIQDSDQGVVVFGQKTLQTQASALDRINVRRLLIASKKFVRNAALNFTFEQNNQATRNEFVTTVEPFFDRVQQRSGLENFEVQMDGDNNPPEIVDQNILVGDIFIQPTRTAEFVQIEFNVLPSGVEFGDEG